MNSNLLIADKYYFCFSVVVYLGYAYLTVENFIKEFKSEFQNLFEVLCVNNI